MKVYLANQYRHKDAMKVAATELRAKGIDVTSTWMDEPHEPNAQLGDLSGDHLVEYAYRDLLEISQADILVFFSVPPTTQTVRGGRHVVHDMPAEIADVCRRFRFALGDEHPDDPVAAARRAVLVGRLSTHGICRFFGRMMLLIYATPARFTAIMPRL